MALLLPPQSTARERYSLSDADLRPLGSLRKDNPHKVGWGWVGGWWGWVGG